jgi:serine protease Do
MFVLMVLMVSLVNAQTLEERFERAYRDAIREAQKSSWALRIIAVALAEAGQLDRALEVAETIDDPIARLQALATIITAKREAEKKKK